MRAICVPGILVCALSACGGVVALNSAGDGGADAGVGSTHSSASGTGVPDSAQLASSREGPGGLGVNQTGTVYRFFPDGTTPYNLRPANEDPNAIDAQDCDDDVILQFTLIESGLPTTDTIQVWAGTTDCSQNTARMAGTGPYCWPVAESGAFGDSQTVTGNIYARNITRFLTSTSDSAELAPPLASVPGQAVCQPLGTPAAHVRTVDVYFLFINNDGITADAYFAYPQAVFVSAMSSSPDAGLESCYAACQVSCMDDAACVNMCEANCQ